MSERQYARRDPEALGDLYMRHVRAMTTEGLHEKSAIAAELAHRDDEIARLREERDKLANLYARFILAAGGRLDQ